MEICSRFEQQTVEVIESKGTGLRMTFVLWYILELLTFNVLCSNAYFLFYRWKTKDEEVQLLVKNNISFMYWGTRILVHVVLTLQYFTIEVLSTGELEWYEKYTGTQDGVEFSLKNFLNYLLCQNSLPYEINA